MRNISPLLMVVMIFYASTLFSQDDTTSLIRTTELPAISLTESELDDYGESQDISWLLQASRDIYVSTAGYTFGPARFRLRGYDTENTIVLINGVPVNDVESGRAYWAAWGGLNDALRNQEINTGLSASAYTFGGIGGSTNIITRASTYSKGVKLTYSLSNRSYVNRLMFIASTGMMENGWAVTASGSRRWAQEGYVEGTFYDAWAYFLSVEKKLNEKHSIGFIGYASPNRRGGAGTAVQEARDLAGSNYYNPYWGYQTGEKRNSRISEYHQPMLMLSHYWNPGEKTQVVSTVSYGFGKGGYTALNWDETGDPRPDYYRNLPSYYYWNNDDVNYEYYTRQWQENPEFRQLNWDHFYFANSKYLYTVENIGGTEGNNITGLRSKYIVEGRRNDISQLGLNINLKHNLKESIILSGGLQTSWYKGFHFNVVEDLLGGEYWLDIDKYANQEPFVITDEAQNDLNNPNRIVMEGDRYAHDYTASVNQYGLYGQAEFTYSKIDGYIAAMSSYTEFWRTGNMRNGKFPDNSYGDSEKHRFFDYGVKAGATYKITGKNFVTANGAFLTRAPNYRNSYISPRTRDFVVSDLVSEKILSGDINYIHRSSLMKARLTFYYTYFNDQTWSRSFYHEDLNTFVNYQMTGVDKVNAGMEVGIEYNVTTTITLTGVFGKGQFIYDSRPEATISRDNDATFLSKRKVYLKNYYVGGMPQTIGSLGIKYNAPRYWWLGLSGNYFGDIYPYLNPDRRTEEALAGLSEDDIRVNDLLNHNELSDGFTVDIYGGKSWKISDYYIGLNISFSNIFDKKDLATGGYEQFRYDPDNIERFPEKYFYLYGRTYFINLNFRF